MRPRPRATPRHAGQSTVELALLLPVVALLLLAVLQAGLVARDIVLVTHASREAARAAAVDPGPGVARRAALAASGLAPERLHVTAARRSGPDGRVRVVLTYRVPMAVPVVGALLGDRTLTASAVMRLEPPP